VVIPEYPFAFSAFSDKINSTMKSRYTLQDPRTEGRR